MWRMFARRNDQAPTAGTGSGLRPDPPVAVQAPRTDTAPALPEASRSIAHIQRLGDAVVATMTAACISGADGITFAGVLRTLRNHHSPQCILDLQNVAQFDAPAVEQLQRFIDEGFDEGMMVAIASSSPNLTSQLNLPMLKHPVPVSRDVMSAREALRRQSPDLAEV